MRKYTLLLILLTIVGLETNAQVTIGSDIPPVNGALLQLKEQESTDADPTTTNRGFSNARVALTKNNELYPMYAEGYPGVTDIAAEKKINTGLVIYNVTTNATTTASLDVFVPGLYIWDGALWTRFHADKVVLPAIEDVLCETATLTPSTYNSDTYYSGILKVSYVGGNGGNYDASAIQAHVANGLTFVPQAGKLNVGDGDIYYRVTGTPTESSPVPTSIIVNFLGKSCTATAGDVQEAKTISFTKTKADYFETATVAKKSITILGNLAVRVEYIQTSISTSSYFLTYKVAIPTHVTLIYSKSGTSVGYVVTGQKAAQNTDAWYRVKTGAYGGDGGLILDSSATDGPNGSKDDLNPGNRDIIEAIFMLHNTNEVYRVTINSNGEINSQGLIGGVPATVTIFLEKLD